jgi:putative oxidoreductase
MEQLSGWKKYGVWVVSGLLTAAFLMAGSMKLLGSEEIVQNFQKWGYPLFFLYVVGLSEVSFTIGLWIPKLLGLAALGLVGLMIGAVGTHIMAAEFNMLAPSLVLGFQSALVFWIRYPQTRQLYFQY